MYHDDSLALNVIVALTAIMIVVWLAKDDCQSNTYPEPPTSGEIVIPETALPETTVEPTPVPDPTRGELVEPAGLETVSETPAEPEDEPIDETTSCPTTPFTEHILLRDAMRRVQERRARGVSYIEKMGEGEDPSFYISFGQGGILHSVHYWPQRDKWGGVRASLSFLERPRGTTGQKHLLTYSDNGVDGCVNFGSHPGGKLLTWNVVGLTNRGVDTYHALWQAHYNAAASAFIRAANY